MTANITSVNDFDGLARLRHEARASTPEATREAARQFEALFVQMMLKSMRDANAVLGEQSDTTYQEMFDRQISLDMTKGKGLGIADLMVRQFGGATAADAERVLEALPGVLERLPALRPAFMPEVAGSGVLEPGAIDLPAVAAPGPLTMTGRSDFRPADREEFVREIWPLAVDAGRKLGVDPKAIIAQAALETGWGSRLIRDDAGVSGNNLFGIKADSRWNGERVTVTTLEYEGGLPKPQRAQFRAYPDLAGGFEDYVRFLQTNPRYSDALRDGAAAGAYADRLQDAGYATDPRYAEKLRGIIASPLIDSLAGGLKPRGELPTYF